MRERNKSSSYKNFCANLGGINVCLKEGDIIEPKKPISIKELLDEAKRLSKMKLFKED